MSEISNLTNKINQVYPQFVEVLRISIEEFNDVKKVLFPLNERERELAMDIGFLLNKLKYLTDIEKIDWMDFVDKKLTIPYELASDFMDIDKHLLDTECRIVISPLDDVNKVVGKLWSERLKLLYQLEDNLEEKETYKKEQENNRTD